MSVIVIIHDSPTARPHNEPWSCQESKTDKQTKILTSPAGSISVVVRAQSLNESAKTERPLEVMLRSSKRTSRSQTNY